MRFTETSSTLWYQLCQRRLACHHARPLCRPGSQGKEFLCFDRTDLEVPSNDLLRGPPSTRGDQMARHRYWGCVGQHRPCYYPSEL